MKTSSSISNAIISNKELCAFCATLSPHQMRNHDMLDVYFPSAMVAWLFYEVLRFTEIYVYRTTKVYV